MTGPLAYTVAMCTHNHADRLERTLTDLHWVQSPQKAWEFLVIDNGSSDATPELLARADWPAGWQVRVVREDKLGLSNARNRAVAEARGEYVIFMDDDETPEPDWLCVLEHLIDARRPDAFGGPMRVQFEDARPRWLTDELLGFLGEVNRGDAVVRLTDDDTTFFGGNFGFRRDVVGRVGGFDTGLGRKGSINIGGEEVDFYLRLLAAGLEVWWTPAAIIHHRIQAAKLTRRYFLDLHYRQGQTEGARARTDSGKSRMPPLYLMPQLARAHGRALSKRLREGADNSLRLEMNAAYSIGYLFGWTRSSA